MSGWADPKQRHDLRKALVDVAGAPITNVFRHPGGLDHKDYQILADAARDLESNKWEARDYYEALKQIIRRAVQLLPNDETPEQGMSMSWREIASTLFGFENAAEAELIETKKAYVRRWEYVRERLYKSKPEFKLDVVSPCFTLLADGLASLAPTAITTPGGKPAAQASAIDFVKASSAIHTIVGITARSDDLFEDLIYRTDYVDRVRAHVERGERIICLWGEGGTGKTVLAAQAALALELGPVVILRVGDERVLWQDMIQALLIEGMNPDSWSEAYCTEKLRQQLRQPSTIRVVVIDNIENEDEIWQIVPREPNVVVLVTSRQKLISPDISTIEIIDFSEVEAAAYIQNRLPDTEEMNARFLAHALGCRPLSLHHAVQFVLISDGMDVVGLADILSRSVTHGLDLITHSPRNLVSLYKATLETLNDNALAMGVLVAFLALAGKEGYCFRRLLFVFLTSESGGSITAAECWSAIHRLKQCGLVRDETKGTHANRHLLRMHPLTYEILRELLGNAPLKIEAAYMVFILENKIIEKPSPDDPWYMIWLHKAELEASENITERWRYLHCVDLRTWMAVRNGSSAQLIVERYDIAERNVYITDYETGERTVMSKELLVDLKVAARAYHERLQAEVYRIAPKGENVIGPQTSNQQT